MVFPGIVRRAMKLMPTLIQALALVVFIHVVGQVKSNLLIIFIVTNSSLIRAFCPGMEVPSTDSANLIKPRGPVPATKFRKLSNTSTAMFQDTHPDLDPKSQLHPRHPRHRQPPDLLHQYHNLRRSKADGWKHCTTLATNTIWEAKVNILISPSWTLKLRSFNLSF